jgi:spoIIIJ-associated protein
MNEEVVVEIKERINFFLKAFGIAGEVVVKKSDGVLVANIVTGRPEILIGRNGQTLFAIQHLVRAMLAEGIEEEHLTVDVEGYRERHNERVKMNAREAALKVLANGKPYHLPPMTSYERRLVHMALADFADLEAVSEGDGLTRHIVIKPKSVSG